jgi:hypothetical protein
MTTRQRIAVLPLLFTAGLLALGACGSTDDGGGVATLDNGGASAAPKASGDAEKEVTAYLECLRGQGVDVPDPTVNEKGELSFGRPANGQSVDRDKLQAAQKKCGEPPAGLMSAAQNTINSPEFQDAALKFAKCMRGEGVDVPDPDFSKVGTGQGGAMFGQLDRDDPKVAAAIEACKHVWTEAGVGPGTGGGN